MGVTDFFGFPRLNLRLVGFLPWFCSATSVLFCRNRSLLVLFLCSLVTPCLCFVILTPAYLLPVYVPLYTLGIINPGFIYVLVS